MSESGAGGWVKPLLKEYAKEKRLLEKYRASLIRPNPKHQSDAELEEIAIVSGMISDMAYAIEWMRRGHQPGVYRGIERRRAYRQPVVLDKDLFPSLQEPEPVQPVRLSTEQRRLAMSAIGNLSPRERDCYLLHAAHGLSYADIGQQLKLSRRTVQQYVERAIKKIPAAQSG